MTQYLLYLYAESPVHTGAANSIDMLDLPIQRESSTKYPVIWGQSLKGALRQAASDSDWAKSAVEEVFGAEPGAGGEEGGTRPGTLTVGDAQLVAMPVPTLKKTFAWVTSELALSRLARKYKLLPDSEALELPTGPVAGGIAAAADWSGEQVLGPCVVPFGNAVNEPLAQWASRIADHALGWDTVFSPFADKLRSDLVLAGSELIPVLLSECTEQAVRVQLSEDKTVQNGPFYSEYLPSETLLAATLTLSRGGDVDKHRLALARLLNGRLNQVGGDETLGKGLVWTRLLPCPVEEGRG